VIVRARFFPGFLSLPAAGIALLVFTGLVLARGSRADSWQQRASMQTPRKNLAATAPAASAEIYAVGGRNDSGTGILATMNEFDPGKNAWTSRASMNYARAGLGAVVISGKIYAVGGYTASGTETGVLESYSVVTDSWAVLNPMPTPRSNFACAEVFGTLYAIGGKSATKFMASVSSYDPKTGNWTVHSDMPVGRAYMVWAARPRRALRVRSWPTTPRKINGGLPRI
jgi:hypothetical protein